MKLTKGLVQVYTGDGKGKTTAALGLALRAIGWNLKVCLIQFIKGNKNIGEIKITKSKIPHFSFHQFRNDQKYFIGDIKSRHFKIAAQKALKKAQQVLKNKKYDVIILDEINNAVAAKLISEKDVLKLIKEKPSWCELILTGRKAPQKIIAAADIVTEMKKIKHSFDKGILARKGIDF